MTAQGAVTGVVPTERSVREGGSRLVSQGAQRNTPCTQLSRSRRGWFLTDAALGVPCLSRWGCSGKVPVSSSGSAPLLRRESPRQDRGNSSCSLPGQRLKHRSGQPRRRLINGRTGLPLSAARSRAQPPPPTPTPARRPRIGSPFATTGPVLAKSGGF